MAKQNSYGIKEVADVYFFPVGTTFSFSGDTFTPYDASGTSISIGSADYIFDSLKVSNIEVAAEETSAKGGKGNPELISWSYGKTATLTVEDALMSLDSLNLMHGGKDDEDENTITIDANSFPGAYTIIGKTVVRSFATQKDEPFYIIIPKGRPQVGGTLTLQAEGDPSTFEMTIKALAADFGGSKDVLVVYKKVEAAGA